MPSEYLAWSCTELGAGLQGTASSFGSYGVSPVGTQACSLWVLSQAGQQRNRGSGCGGPAGVARALFSESQSEGSGGHVLGAVMSEQTEALRGSLCLSWGQGQGPLCWPPSK